MLVLVMMGPQAGRPPDLTLGLSGWLPWLAMRSRSKNAFELGLGRVRGLLRRALDRNSMAKRGSSAFGMWDEEAIEYQNFGCPGLPEFLSYGVDWGSI